MARSEFGLVATKGVSWARVRALAVLPDGRVVAASEDSTPKVYDPNVGHLRTFTSPTFSSVECVAALSNGQFLTGARDRTVRRWQTNDATVGELVNQTFLPDIPRLLAVAPDGRVVITLENFETTVWDLSGDGRCLVTLSRYRHSISCIVAISNERLVAASYDLTVREWDLSNGQILRSVTPASGAPRCVARLPGTRVAVGLAGHAHVIEVWDLEFSQSLQTMSAPDLYCVACIAALPGGRVVSGGYTPPEPSTSLLKIWELATGRCLQSLAGAGPTMSQLSCVAVLQDGRIITGTTNGTLRTFTDRQRVAERRLLLQVVRQMGKLCQDVVPVIKKYL